MAGHARRCPDSTLNWTIVSGGQTGVDRAALDAARRLGLAYGGYVPRGRRAEDGPLPDDYAGMIETKARHPATRTALNVAQSDATLILCRGKPDGGTMLTLEKARAIGKPHLLLDLDEEDVAGRLSNWLVHLGGGRLNVAGPRESKCPGIYAEALAMLMQVLGGLGRSPTSHDH